MGMAEKASNLLVTTAVVGGGLFVASKVFDFELPACLRHPSIDNCTPDINIDLPKIPGVGGDNRYTSEVKGGIVSIDVRPLDWPLFERVVVIDPLEIKNDGKTDYESRSFNRVTTSMVGRIAAINFGEGAKRETYVLAVDDQKTEDPTDDKLVPIDVNKFQMISRKDVVEKTYAPSLEADYNNCVTQLKSGDPSFGGCVLSGVDGHDKPIAAEVLNNISAEYISSDDCVIDTLHAASNLVLEGKTPDNKWMKEYGKTVTVGEVTAVSLRDRIASLEGTTAANTHVIMALDSLGKPAEWKPDNPVDLSQVEQLSGGKYKAPDVRVSNFCLDGSYQNNEPAQFHIDHLKEKGKLGPQLLDPVWLGQFAYTKVPIPAELQGVKFMPDGSFTGPAGPIKTGG
jgi:hypothetical protein